jgi:hypothetical protein
MQPNLRAALVRALLKAAALLLAVIATAPSARAQDELARLEAMWKRGEYASTLPALLEYRDRTRTKTCQIDYMIATSACRLPQHRRTGESFFGWILDTYPLSNQNRNIIKFEKGRCATGAPPEMLRAGSPATLVGITYSGKGGTGYRASSSGNGASEVIEPIPSVEFAARLFAPSQWQPAVASIRGLLGPDSQIERVGYLILVAPATKAFELSGSSETESHPSREIPNRAAIANRTAEAPNPAAIANLSAEAPNRAAVADQSAPSIQAENPKNGARGTQPGASLNGIGPAAVNTAGMEPRNVNPASVNSQNVPRAPNHDASQLNVQQRAEPGHVVQRSTTGYVETSDLVRAGEDLEKYARFFISEYGMQAPSHLITIYFTPGVDQLRSLARKIHGIALAPGSIGYSFPGDQSMVAWADGKAYGTFAHELFHLMVRGNFGDAPPWLDEGMAALYEVSGFENDRAVGVTNWRGKILRELWATRPSLRQLVQMDRSSFDDIDDAPYRGDGREELVAGAKQAVNHATARYFMLYLQERGQLRRVYEAFFNRKVTDQPGRQAIELLESELQRSIDQVDADFAEWFKSFRN